MANETRTDGNGQAATATTAAPDEFQRLLEKPHEVSQVGVFADPKHFEHAQRVAGMLVASKLAPEIFQGKENLGSAVIAVDMAFRLRMNPLMVMQQIYIVYGKPGWSSQFIIACLNSCGRYSPLRFEITGNGDERTCQAWAIEKETGQRLEGPPVSIKMAKDEGWFTKNGSKWKTLPELMLRYRSATFFGRLYAPELLMGMQAVEEIVDVGDEIQRAITTKPTFTPAPEGNSKPATVAETPSQPEKEPSASAPVATGNPPSERTTTTVQQGLWLFLSANNVAFDDFRSWLVATGLYPEADSLASIDDLPTDVANKLEADKKALAKCVKIYGAKEATK